MDFKTKFKRYRNEKKLTQKELADKLFVSRTTVTEIESGKIKPALKIVTKLSELSGLSFAYWVEGSVEKDFNIYKPLDELLKTLILSDFIKSDGKLNEICSKLILVTIENNIIKKIYEEEKGEI